MNTNLTAHLTRAVKKVSPTSIVLISFLLIVVSLALRIMNMGFESPDYLTSEDNWLRQFDFYGFKAFGKDFYDYNPPYLYMLYITKHIFPYMYLVVVKVVSFVFDIAMVAGIAAITQHVLRQKHITFFVAALAFILPEVVLNSAVWGQVDASYVLFLVWMLYFLIKRQDIPAWIMFGFAVAFKAQALFVLPALILVLLLQKKSLWRGLVILPAFFIWYIPCLLSGRSFQSLISIYFNQVNTYPFLSNGAPNLYMLIDNHFFFPVHLVAFGLTIGASVVLFIFLYRGLKQHFLTAGLIIKIFFTYALVVPFLLPEMHERYFYMAAIFAFLVAVFDSAYIKVAVLIQIANVLACFDLFMDAQTHKITQFQFFLDPRHWLWLTRVAIIPETLAVILAVWLLAKLMRQLNPKKELQPTQLPGIE